MVTLGIRVLQTLPVLRSIKKVRLSVRSVNKKVKQSIFASGARKPWVALQVAKMKD
jgi:hypothetical protein